MNNRLLQRIKIQTTLLAVGVSVALLINGCGVSPPASYPPPAVPPEDPSGAQTLRQEQYQPPGGRGAVLYTDARKAMAEGRYDKAELTLERALRVEPRNGYYWFSLAEVKYYRGNYSQAVQMALKSRSLSGGDTALLRRNDALIAAARTKMSGN